MVPKKEHNPKSNQRKPKAFSKGRHRAPDGKSPTHKTKGQKGGQKSSKSKQHKTKDKDRAQNSPKQQLKQDGNAKNKQAKGKAKRRTQQRKQSVRLLSRCGVTTKHRPRKARGHPVTAARSQKKHPNSLIAAGPLRTRNRHCATLPVSGASRPP